MQTIPAWQYIFSMIIYTAILYVIVELSRKYLKATTIVGILILFTFPLWIKTFGNDWFRLGKVLIVIIPTTCFVNVLRINNKYDGKGIAFLKKNWVLWALYVILFCNILEASIKDFTLGNYFNFIAGILCCITIPLPPKNWRFGAKEGFGELICDIPLMWCLLYTTWNMGFVYAENTGFFASSLCILAVPEIYSIIRKRSDLWLHARVYTLAAHMFIRATFGDIFNPIMGSIAWRNEAIIPWIGIFNMVFAIAYTIWWFRKLNIDKKQNQGSLTA
ncbi:hypothetical protein [Clostridium chauvoei]|uniref:Uncharacterized protein n=2 Tax=Clostridium chauvoei TaxID=46867 RepID=S6F688_9CLOT|nr:hypothetical protein [Clostridium chauvoei]ATD55986.1 hypothetical protein BTM20_12545 [Clostridium chauvoei]ATD56345.1 hypothetical protein BTM21_00470 [Clostridium chauvoei]MBX7280884.1 hypothetical protein [Clostridium chauvoei]MBX7283367.1 hypothetical protein [Clostridium chauvoei]MBX7285950.1 hypothetical protein [Clostridium chauvoei]